MGDHCCPVPRGLSRQVPVREGCRVRHQSHVAATCAHQQIVWRDLRRAISQVGGVSYTGFNQDGWGIKSDVLFNFDLQLDAAFTPVPTDGEVSDFRLVPIPEVGTALCDSSSHALPIKWHPEAPPPASLCHYMWRPCRTPNAT